MFAHMLRWEGSWCPPLTSDGSCLSPRLQSTIGWVTPEEQKFTSHSCGGWKSGSQGQVADFSLDPHLGKGPGALWASLQVHSLLLILRAPPLWPDHTQGPHLLTRHLAGENFHMNLRRGRNIWPIAVPANEANIYTGRPPKTCAHFTSW